ncbi:MAG: LON peptidase substrate-binding domain-containing protein, partial [Gemmatimonadaceae bacterium]
MAPPAPEQDSRRLPVLPLRDVVVFPFVAMPLIVGREGSLGAIEAAAAEGGLLFLVAQRNADTEEPAAGDLHRVGTVARIVQATRQSNGTARILVEGVSRARVTRYIPASGHLRAALAEEPETSADDAANLNVLARRVVALFEEYIALHRRIPNEVVALIQSAESVARQAYGIAAHLAVRVEVRQNLLE